MARALPAGTVTFLISDIEGSTRLFHRLGSDYVPLLAEHRRLLGEAVARHSGAEVETEGDGLLLAFGDAVEAVAAALDGQRALAAHRWPAGGDVRVRIGLHTGEAAPEGDGYVSLAVHQAARISAAAHGGQILMSEATATATTGRLPAGATVAPLGSFQLRGFPAPERLFQLVHPDLPGGFPPPRALGVVAHNLPFLRTALVGRDAERTALTGLLAETGLVTVVGPGGVGKTRLAVQVGFDVMDDYDDGAWLVELAPLTDPALVPAAVAAVLDVAEEPGRAIEDLLVEAVAPKSLLLVLDNCEHLLDAVAALVERLSQHCPHLSLLVTSREPLDVDGEAVWRLPPLPGDEAVRLFAERAGLIRPGFRVTDDNAAAVGQLVAHLDGIPLAIELAAAALIDRPLAAVLQGLGDRFALLARGRRAAGRHSTLRAALEWSLDLLTPDERRVFARLAVFAGHGTLDAAAEVCAGDPVAPGSAPAAIRRLMRASLMVPHPEVAERWSMLESVRELGTVELSATGDTEAAARHRRWFAARAEALGPDVGRADRPEALRELTADHDNIRHALDSAVAAGDADTGLRLCIAMGPFWLAGMHWTEGIARLRAVLALSGDDDGLRARGLAAAGQLLVLRGDLADADAMFTEARARAAAAGDDLALARALSGAGLIAFRGSRLAESQQLWEESLTHAERAGDDRAVAMALRSLAIGAGSHGDQDTAGRLLDRALASARRLGDDQLIRQLLGSLAEMHLWTGAYQQSADEYGDALERATRIGDLSARPLLLAELGWVALLRGEVAVAAQLAAESIGFAEEFVNRRVLAHAVRLQGETLLRRGRPDDAAAALDRALTVAREFGAGAEIAGVLCSQALAALEGLRLDEARELADRALELFALPHPMRLVSPQWVRGSAALRLGDPAVAVPDFEKDLTFRGGAAGPRFVANATFGLACVDAARGRTPEALAGLATVLRMRSRMGDRLGVAESLRALAGALPPENSSDAARLVGASSQVLAAVGAVPTPRQAADLASAVRATGQTAGDAAAMTETQAVALALELGARMGAGAPAHAT
ncbi:MAG TPA: adenylate/guanylate cyclase domain-containing protein [Blastococcus sp.]|nr:adenylate/guanylate cyclase domain-containing protein [Blastococcus sp.]